VSDWHVSAEARADGTVGLRLYRFIPAADAALGHHERAEYVISHDDAWHLFTHLAGLLRSQSGERMRNAAAGDCATCGNLRLIDVPRTNGPGTEHIYCPRCHDRYTNAEPAYPSWPDPEEPA
jgi:hypothetical protein